MHDRGIDRAGDLDSNAEDWCVEIMPCCGRHPWRCQCDSAREMLVNMAALGYHLEMDAEEMPIAHNR